MIQRPFVGQLFTEHVVKVHLYLIVLNSSLEFHLSRASSVKDLNSAIKLKRFSFYLNLTKRNEKISILLPKHLCSNSNSLLCRGMLSTLFKVTSIYLLVKYWHFSFMFAHSCLCVVKMCTSCAFKAKSMLYLTNCMCFYCLPLGFANSGCIQSRWVQVIMTFFTMTKLIQISNLPPLCAEHFVEKEKRRTIIYCNSIWHWSIKMYWVSFFPSFLIPLNSSFLFFLFPHVGFPNLWILSIVYWKKFWSKLNNFMCYLCLVCTDNWPNCQQYLNSCNDPSQSTVAQNCQLTCGRCSPTGSYPK